MRKGIFISILSALLFASCSNLHFGEGTSVSLYLPALDENNANLQNARMCTSPNQTFDGKNYDTDTIYYEINLMHGNEVKYSKEATGGRIVFNNITPGDYSIECFAKVKRNSVKTAYLSGYTEISVVKGLSTVAEVNMVDCPIITRQPEYVLYTAPDDLKSWQGISSSVNIALSDTDNKAYEWYFDDSKKLLDSYFFSMQTEIQFDYDPYSVHSINCVVYNKSDDGNIDKKNGFVRAQTSYTYPIANSDVDDSTTVQLKSYLGDKVIPITGYLYPEDFYLQINLKNKTIILPHLNKDYFSSGLRVTADSDNFNFNSITSNPVKAIFKNDYLLGTPLSGSSDEISKQVKIGYEFDVQFVNAEQEYGYTDYEITYNEVPVGFYGDYDNYFSNTYPLYIISQDQNLITGYQWYACKQDGAIICALDGKTEQSLTLDETISYQYFKVRITISGLSEHVTNATNGKFEYWSGVFFPGA